MGLHPGIQKLSEFTNKEVVCIYGEGGAGKSTFIADVPRTLIIKPKAETLASIPHPENVDVWEVSTWNDIFEVPQSLVAEGNGKRWDWVWIDSFSILQQYGLDDVYQASVDGSKQPDKRLLYNPSQGDYQLNMNRLRRLIYEMAGCGLFNFGFTCHIAKVQDPFGALVYGPQIQGKDMNNNLTGICTVVGYLEKCEGYRALRLDSTNVYQAKFAYNKHGAEGEKTKPLKRNPALSDLIARINEYKAPAKKVRTPPIVKETV